MSQSPQRDGSGEAKHADRCVERKETTATEADSEGWTGGDGVKCGGREERKRRSFLLYTHPNYSTKDFEIIIYGLKDCEIFLFP